MALRCATLGRQIVGGDELHAVRAALSMPISEILVTFRETDHSIPLAALFRLAFDLGIPLGELELRVPALIASLALLVLAPLWAAPLVGARAAKYWALALAISPLLVMYGRMVRSYSPVLALSTLALLAFLRFWRSGDWRFAMAYAVAGALAIWFHVGSGPIVCAPLVVAAGLLCTGRAQGRNGRDLFALSAGLGAIGAALLLPAWPTLRALIELKSGGAGSSLRVALEVAQLYAGTTSPQLALGLAGVVAAGIWRLWRRAESDRSVALLVAGAPLVQWVGLALLAPRLDSPILAARAMLVALPWLALAVAVALADLHRPDWRRFAPALCAVVALLAGPFFDAGYWRSSFQLHDDYIAFTRPRPDLGQAALPELYGQLEGEGGLVELPWHPFWGFGHAVPAYQEVHGREVWVSNAQPLGSDPRMRWRRFQPQDPAQLLKGEARYAVLHLDMEEEESRARAAMGPDAAVRPQPHHWELLRREGIRARRMLATAWGLPDLEDADVAIWDLARLRRSSGGER